MISLTRIALLVASAALMVSAGPTAVPEAVRSIPKETYFDHRSITRSDDPRLEKRNGELYCGNFASADFFNGHQLVQEINANWGAEHTIAAHGCLRVGCKNTSGVYVCNDRSGALTVSNGEIMQHTETILDRCCIHNKDGNLDNQKQSGGQQFTNALGGGWNVVIAYANCNHPATQIPSTYNGGTVNGMGCQAAAMFID